MTPRPKKTGQKTPFTVSPSSSLKLSGARIVFGLILILLSAAVFSGSGAAVEGNWADYAPTAFTDENISVSGTTFTIHNAYGLAWMAYDINTKEDNRSGMTWNLDENIDLGAHEWTPIGNTTNPVSDSRIFKGTFDGKEKTIKNLSINQGSKNYQGLFGYTDKNSVICNVSLDNVSVTGSDRVGGLVGTACGDVSNCYATGAVTGKDAVGGLVGWQDGGSISNCYATGTVTGTGYSVGGLVGSAGDSIISNCYATGAVTGKDAVGGLVGFARYLSDISNCYATGAVTGTTGVGGLVGNTDYAFVISNCYATGAVTGTISVGGLVGCPDGGFISNCYATGDVTGTTYVGGLVGWQASGSTISNCYATGAVTGTAMGAGGLVGYASGSTISNCNATGAVTGTTGVGGLVGLADGSVSNCNATGALTGKDAVGGLVGQASGSINNCNATGAVTGTGENVGGLVGSASGSISNCNATGAVTGDTKVGGLVGFQDSDSTITNCYATGTVTGNQYVGGLVGQVDGGSISNCNAAGVVTGTNQVGGLVGKVDGGSITNCNAAGAVTGTGQVGGLVGYQYRGSISNCNATGAVTGTGDYVGGLVGGAGGSIISNCYATGTVKGTGHVGGLVGWQESGSVSNCYATGAVTGDNFVGGLVGSGSSISNISNSLALNPSVNGASNVGRVVGINKGTIGSNCYGWENMLVNDGKVTTPDGIHGENIASPQVWNTFTEATAGTAPWTGFTAENWTLNPAANLNFRLPVPKLITAGDSVSDASHLAPCVEVYTWQELAAKAGEWIDTENMRTIVLRNETAGAYKNATGTGGYGGIPIKGKVNIVPDKDAGEITVDANRKGRLFNISGGGSLTLAGNGSAMLTLTGGSFSGNGGGVYNQGTFAMTGGSITGCTADSGGGVYNDGEFTLSGTAVVDAGNEVYLKSGRKITLGTGGFNGDDYGAKNIASESTAKDTVIVDGSQAPDKLSIANFVYKGTSSFALIKKDNNLVLDYAARINDTKYETVEKAFNKAAAGETIVLLADSILRDEITIKGETGSQSVTLDLNGSTLYAAQNKRLFTIESGASFNLTDSNGGGKLTGGNVTSSIGGGVLVSDGTFNMTGGSITECTSYGNGGGGVAVNGGTFNMTGGSITGCEAKSNCGGGVYVYNGGTFTMESGSISDCTANLNGGGVCVRDSIFTMNNGEITRCSAEKNGGGGVDVISGTFNMTGGSIKNCEAVGVNGMSGGVSVSGSFNMSGGSITGCKAALLTGGVTIVSGTILNVSGNVEITGNKLLSGQAGNLFSASDNAINLTGPFTGSIGIFKAGAVPAAGLKFGNATAGASGAEKFFSDDGKFIGSISGSDLVWVNKPTPAPQPTFVPTQRHYSGGGTTNTGAGNYNYYPRQADGKAETISFGTSKTVKAVELPAGVTGEVTLVAKSSVPAPSGYSTYNVFEINIPTYPTGEKAVIDFEVPLNTLAKEGKTPADVGLLHGDGTNWDAGTLPTTFTVNEENAVYHSTTTAFSPFAIVYVDGAATAETPEAAAAVVAVYDPAKDETEPVVVVAAEKTVVTVQTAEPTAKATEAPKTPFEIAGLIAGLGAACVLVLRRRE